MDAEDALARAMLKAFEKLPANAREIINLRAWLTRFTFNVCMDLHRERARRESTVESVENVEALDVAVDVKVESPESAIVRREQEARLRQALNSLPSKLREPFILRFLNDMAYEEIAECLNLTPANVRKRIQQAREKLKGMLTSLSEF